MHDHIDTLYETARDRSARDPIWDELRAAEAAEMPSCVNHPGRATVGGFDDAFYCAECVGPELIRRRLWLVSFRLVRGGLEALR